MQATRISDQQGGFETSQDHGHATLRVEGMRSMNSLASTVAGVTLWCHIHPPGHSLCYLLGSALAEAVDIGSPAVRNNLGLHVRFTTGSETRDLNLL
jgi:hypothetical protein